VVSARLADARFFYEHDLKVPLEQLLPRLDGVGFLQKMGSMKDKTERVKRSVEQMADFLKFEASEKSDALRAATLAKTDLVTLMVGEFPELQGVAGRFFSVSTEKPAVAQAIEQHYWPLSAEGALPKSPEASLVALADKLDKRATGYGATKRT
jgi:glycyl-tRNA synthetase beta chain